MRRSVRRLSAQTPLLGDGTLASSPFDHPHLSTRKRLRHDDDDEDEEDDDDEPLASSLDDEIGFPLHVNRKSMFVQPVASIST